MNLLRSAPLRLATVLAAAALLGTVATVASPAAQASPVRPSVPAVSCPGSTVCNPSHWSANMFAAPELSGTYVKLDYGTGLYINCWAYGQNVSGPWGTSNIWDYVNWTTKYGGAPPNGYGYSGYVSDTVVYTGTNGPPWWVGQCPSSLRGNA